MTDPNNISFIPKEPYSPTQKSACLYPRADMHGRRYVRFLASSGCESMSGMSYARYIFQIDYWKKYQQWIPDDLEVDHINNNFLDDRIENLQLLTHAQNMQKMNAVRGYGAYVVVCMYCGNQHIVKKWALDEHMNKPNSPAMCCSRSCVSSSIGDTKLIGKTREWVKTNQVQYEIRSHYFEYTEWYHDYYPYTELIACKSRALVGYKGIDHLKSRLPIDLRRSAETELCAPINRAKLIQEYINEGKPIPVIANFLDLHEATIYNYITRYNLLVPYREDRFIKISEIVDLLKSGLSPKQVSDKMGIHYNMVLHHANRINIPLPGLVYKNIIKNEIPRLCVEENKSIDEIITIYPTISRRSILNALLDYKKKHNLPLSRQAMVGSRIAALH